MSVTLRLVHRAGYTYQGPAVASYNEARMVPRSTVAQTVSHTRMEITPAPWQHSWTDYWGSKVTTFELHEPHDELKVVAISTVTVHRPESLGKGLSWTDLTSRDTIDDLSEFLEVDGSCEPGPELCVEVARLRANCDTPADFVAAVQQLLHQRISYDPRRSAHHISARAVWESGRAGVIDYAHLVLSALREVGIPARYVAGYVLNDRDAPIGDVRSGHGHAWIEWWDGDWVAVDPAEQTVPDDFYIEVAHARDHTDVVPLRGIYTGTPGSKMSVTVEISRLA
ncbi:transglutaminase family protein [Calidifontibacter terrae]